MHATVVGAGVSGLTTATALVEAGWTVDIVARQHHDDTVSSVAAAIWTSTTVEPQALTREWALTTREQFVVLASDPDTGIQPLMQREFEPVDPGPTFWESTPFVRRLEQHELPSEYATGFEIDGFIIHPSQYLGWLSSRLTAAGVTITYETVDKLADLAGDLIVNCSGLGARELVGDDKMVPIRGQIVAVTNPGIDDGVADEGDADRVTYVYPRTNEVILGGARQIGDSDTAADNDLTARILADAAKLDPRTIGTEVLDVRVGLRPGRPYVRVEADQMQDGRPIVHNYGHAGAGFLLSWGCASLVTELAAAALSIDDA